MFALIVFIWSLSAATLWFWDAFARVNPDKQPLQYYYRMPGLAETYKSEDPVVVNLVKKSEKAFFLSIASMAICAVLFLNAPPLKLIFHG